MLEASPHFQLEPQVITMTLLTLPGPNLLRARRGHLPVQDEVTQEQQSRLPLCALILGAVCSQPVRRRGLTQHLRSLLSSRPSLLTALAFWTG